MIIPTKDTAADLARALSGQRNGRGWMACCPAHDDRTPSLSIADGAEGRILLTCFAGCTWETTDREALEAWLRDPDAVRLGSKMPNYHLTEEEIDALVAYLYSLE